jgi:hypothetical protein
MAIYKLSPLYKKSAIERTYFYKDGKVLVHEEGWRWGNYSGDFDTRPDIDLTEDIEISSEEGWDLDSLDDGCWGDWEYPEGMTEEEQEEIQAAYDENYIEGLEELGWVQDEYECWLQAPLRLEAEDGTVWTGLDDEENLDIDLDGGVSAINEQVQLAVTASWPFPTNKTVLNPDAEWPFPMSQPPAEDTVQQDSSSTSGSSLDTSSGDSSSSDSSGSSDS